MSAAPINGLDRGPDDPIKIGISDKELAMAGLRSLYVRTQALLTDLTLMAKGVECGAISPQQAVDMAIDQGYGRWMPLFFLQLAGHDEADVELEAAE